MLEVQDTLMQMIISAWVSQLIYVAAKMGVADLLKDGSKSNDELASSLDVNAGALYRILRALSSLGIFAEIENRHWKLTPMAEYLLSCHPNSLREMAMFMGSATITWEVWGNLFYSVKTGQPAFDYVNGMPIFEYLAQNKEASAIFYGGMNSYSTVEAAAVVESYDFSSIKTLVDVGGGYGYLLSSILKANPTVKGIVYDLPSVVETATQHQQIAEIQGRCSFVSGSFFDGVPNADVYLIKHVLHDWEDSQCITILKNCYNAIASDGKLLVIEIVIPGANEPSMGKIMDIEMLIMTNSGRQRTAEEFKELFAKGGFELTRIIPTSSPISIIEGIKNKM